MEVAGLPVRTQVWDEPPAPLMRVEILTDHVIHLIDLPLPLEVDTSRRLFTHFPSLPTDVLLELIAHVYGVEAVTRTARVVTAPVPTGPQLSRPVARLIAGAVEHLPPYLRARYEYDFRTDALWIEGRWARLRYALALRLWTVRRLRSAARDLPRRA